MKLQGELNISPHPKRKGRMCDYEPKGRGNKKKDKAKEKYERNGKNTARGVRHIEQVQTQVKKQSKPKEN